MRDISRSSLPKRTSAPITKAVGDPSDQRKGLYVPFEYAAWMDAQTGKWERYQCNTLKKGDKCVVQHSSPGRKAPKRIVTDGLATCVSINVISRKGTIITHIPPYVCRMINGEKSSDRDGQKRQQTENIKSAVKQLKKNYLEDMGETTVVAISGFRAANDFMKTQQEVTKAIQEIIGLRVNKWEHLDNHMEGFEGWRSTTVDMTVSPPQFYKENTKMAINVP